MGEEDWEQRLSEMIQTAEQNAIDWKLSAVTTGKRGGVLDQIEIVVEEWMHLNKKK